MALILLYNKAMAASPLQTRIVSPAPHHANNSTGRSHVARPVPAKEGVIKKVLHFFTAPSTTGPAPRHVNPNNATYRQGNPNHIREPRALASVVNGNTARSTQPQLVPDQALVSFLDSAFLNK